MVITSSTCIIITDLRKVIAKTKQCLQQIVRGDIKGDIEGVKTRIRVTERGIEREEIKR